jgi:lipoyl synthase
MNSNPIKELKSSKPPWLKQRISINNARHQIVHLLRKSRLHTVCEEASCPNLGECFSRKTATFLILGDQCTRNCRFCSIAHGKPVLPDPEEPQKVAEAALTLGLRYVVVTSVTRDDLPDGGAAHFAQTIQEIRHRIPGAIVEILVPDFNGDITAIETVVNAHPDVINHNIETVSNLYVKVRPAANYQRSLELLEKVSVMDSGILTKSGLMLGLGEIDTEIRQVLCDLLQVNCRILTMGQYLQPSQDQLTVERYVTPDEFEHWKNVALKMGFLQVASGPFVRSSYHAGELFKSLHQSSQS